MILIGLSKESSDLTLMVFFRVLVEDTEFGVLFLCYKYDNLSMFLFKPP